MTARFITLEGGEGVGKSTQGPLLAEAIRARGHDVILTREPGGTRGAEAIRGLLVAGDPDDWGARAEALLFAAARADHVEKLIRPALDRGQWVICDRFIDSTRVYQGGTPQLSDDGIMALHRVGSGGLLPDRTLLLALDAGTVAGRIGDRSLDDRLEARGQARSAEIADRFMALAIRHPGRIRVVDGSGAPEAVTKRLVAALDGLW